MKPNQLMKENIYTAANCATLIRMVIGGTCFYMAFASHSEIWNYAGLLTHWLLDVVDGNLARSLKQETLLGAQFDILADRLLITFFYLNYLIFHPANLLVVILFLFEFALLDHYLSNQFLNWGIISPNYFYRVDRLIWILNWSAPGKFVNSGLVTILLITTNAVVPALIVVLLLIALKVFSFARLEHLVQALPSWRARVQRRRSKVRLVPGRGLGATMARLGRVQPLGARRSGARSGRAILPRAMQRADDRPSA